MTLLMFIIAFGSAWLYFTVEKTVFLWAAGPTIYTVAMYASLLIASIFSIRHMLKTNDSAPLFVCVTMALLILFGWRIGWVYGPPGLLHGTAYALVGALFLAVCNRRWLIGIGILLMLLSLCSFAAVLGAFPKRPYIFTGFYYPDIMAFGCHACLIVAGVNADDGAHRLYRSLRNRHRFANFVEVRPSNFRSFNAKDK